MNTKTIRKPKVTAKGQMSPLTQLKQRVLEDPDLRDELYERTSLESCAEWIARVNKELGLNLPGHRSAVGRYRRFVEQLHAIEDQESRMAVVVQKYREQYPDETHHQIDQRALLYFKQEAFAMGDVDRFIKIARYGVTLQAQATKERRQAVDERVANLKIKVLELRLALLQTPPANPHLSKDRTQPQKENAAEVPTPTPVAQSCRSAVTDPAPAVAAIEPNAVPDPTLPQSRRHSPALYPLYPLFHLSPISLSHALPLPARLSLSGSPSSTPASTSVTYEGLNAK